MIGFAARYYHHAPGEVFATAVPTLWRTACEHQLAETTWLITAAGRDALDDALRRRAPIQHAVLDALSEAAGGLAADVLDARVPGWRRLRKPLSARGWLECTSNLPRPEHHTRPAQAGPVLNREQQTAADTILSGNGFGAYVLDGVTGSGKTEVYLSALQQALDAGRQALVLVPEIGLTPQLADRLTRRLGIEPVLYHSELADRDRARAWLAAREGEARLILGTRSAVFLPLVRPGLIVVDEEHDLSLKQHEGFRYHARDLAVWRARAAEVPVILGSATPALETLHNARNGRYTRLQLTERAGKARPPRLAVLDLNRYHVVDGLAQPAIDAMRAHIDQGHQVLVYLNRRGFAPTLVCTGCGALVDCPNCDARLTLHRNAQQLQCHHCGTRQPIPTQCSACGSALQALGEGTERVEDALTSAFPEVPLARIDSDTTSGRGALADVLARAHAGEVSILLGTQMLAKGHDLPNIGLVVIVNLDQGFFANDLRASERLAQTLVQVAGRAGRADIEGEVLLQTAFPNHPLLATLVGGGYGAFADAALAERSAALWPPATHIAVLHGAARAEADAVAFLRSAAKVFDGTDSPVRVLGPAPATLLRRRNRFRYRLLLQADSRAALQHGLAHLDGWLAAQSASGDLRWSLDVDPQHDV